MYYTHTHILCPYVRVEQHASVLISLDEISITPWHLFWDANKAKTLLRLGSVCSTQSP